MTQDLNQPPLNTDGKMDGQLSSGKLLQAAREARQLTHADVASKLRLSEQYVKDLEADDFTHIGARTYVRGYLLSYAKLLGIQQADMILAMQVALLPEENMSMQRMLEREKPVINISLRPRGHYKRHLSRWFSVVIFIAIVVMVVFWWQSQNKHVYSSAEIDKVERASTAVLQTNEQSGGDKPLLNQGLQVPSAQALPLNPAAQGQSPATATSLPATVGAPANPTTTVAPANAATIDTPVQQQTPVITTGSAVPPNLNQPQTPAIDNGTVNNSTSVQQQPTASANASSQTTAGQPAAQVQSTTTSNTARHSSVKSRHHNRHSRANQLPAPGAT